MPLFIIAIIFLIGLLIYVIVGYRTGNYDDTPVRIRFPEKFKRKSTDVDYTVVEEDEEENEEENAQKDESNNIKEEDSNETQGF